MGSVRRNLMGTKTLRTRRELNEGLFFSFSVMKESSLVSLRRCAVFQDWRTGA